MSRGVWFALGLIIGISPEKVRRKLDKPSARVSYVTLGFKQADLDRVYEEAFQAGERCGRLNASMGAK